MNQLQNVKRKYHMDVIKEGISSKDKINKIKYLLVQVHKVHFCSKAFFALKMKG